MQLHKFGYMRFEAGVWDDRTNGRVDARSYEDAAERVAGRGLTLIADARIRRIGFLVAKVWDGAGSRYVYRYPKAGEQAA